MADWVQRYRAYILALLVPVVAVGAVFFWAKSSPKPAPIIISTPVPTLAPTSAPTSTPTPLRIYVTGAVHAPDVYILDPGTIVKDAIAAAGGATAEADLDRINLALVLQDQQHIYVPVKGQEVPPISVPDRSSPIDLSSGSVNINTASSETLQTLPGIGPALAQRIIDYRTANGPFQQIADLENVSGIGPATLENLGSQITVGP